MVITEDVSKAGVSIATSCNLLGPKISIPLEDLQLPQVHVVDTWNMLSKLSS